MELGQYSGKFTSIKAVVFYKVWVAVYEAVFDMLFGFTFTCVSNTLMFKKT